MKLKDNAKHVNLQLSYMLIVLINPHKIFDQTKKSHVPHVKEGSVHTPPSPPPLANDATGYFW